MKIGKINLSGESLSKVCMVLSAVGALVGIVADKLEDERQEERMKEIAGEVYTERKSKEG